MRQSNQKSRSRGRGRKPQNPMSRNFESNGPDVKIRGNAAHIAEKYSTLARDALSNGDRVIAENYLQHAEHYNRIVAAAQQQSEARAAEQAEKRQAEQEAEPAESSDEVETASNSESETETSETEAAPKERKNPRTRRPKKQADAEHSNGAAEETESGKSEKQPAVPVEAISEDAAKLPEGLLGGMAAEEG